MLLIESFEKATDLILEGIDSGDVLLILEAGEKFTKLVEEYKALIDSTVGIYSGAPKLAATVKDILDNIKAEIEKVEEPPPVDFENEKASWSNLLKLKSPWESESGASGMSTLSTYGAKLDIIVSGMLKSIGNIGRVCVKYEHIFVVNSKSGIAIKPNIKISPEFILSGIIGKSDEDLIRVLTDGNPGTDLGPLAPDNEDGDSSGDEDTETSNEGQYKVGNQLNEILGMGGPSKKLLSTIYNSFPNLREEMPADDKKEQAKQLYKYFSNLAEDLEKLKEKLIEDLIGAEPSKKYQSVVKKSSSGWMASLFGSDAKYKITKEEAKKLIGGDGDGGLLDIKISSFAGILANLQKAKETPAKLNNDTNEVVEDQLETNQNHIEGNDDLQKMEQEVENEQKSQEADSEDSGKAPQSEEEIIEAKAENEDDKDKSEFKINKDEVMKKLNQSADKFKMEGVDIAVTEALMLLEEFRQDNPLQERGALAKMTKNKRRKSKKKYQSVRKKAQKDYGIQVKKVDDEKTTVDKAEKKIDNIETNALKSKDVQKFSKRKENIKGDADKAKTDVKKEDQENKAGSDKENKPSKSKQGIQNALDSIVTDAGEKLALGDLKDLEIIDNKNKPKMDKDKASKEMKDNSWPNVFPNEVGNKTRGDSSKEPTFEKGKKQSDLKKATLDYIDKDPISADPKLAKAKKRTKLKVKQVIHKATKDSTGKYLVKDDKIGKEHFPDKPISPLKKTSPQDLAVGLKIAEANLLERWAKLAGILND